MPLRKRSRWWWLGPLASSVIFLASLVVLYYIIREIEPEQPVERAATLSDVRAEVLAPNRLNALVFGGFAAVALLVCFTE